MGGSCGGDHSPAAKTGSTRQPQERHHSAANGGTRDLLPPAWGAERLLYRASRGLPALASRALPVK